MERAAPWARTARAIEEPIRPIPISARRLKIGAPFMEGNPAARPRRSSPFAGRGQGSGTRRTARRTASPLLPHELRQRGDHEAIRLLGAYAHAQGVRQFIGLDATQDQPALGQEGVGVLGGTAAN